jgi:fibronectin-binding autotransporter adhesin
MGMSDGLKAVLVTGLVSLAVAAPAVGKTYEVNKRSDHAPNGCKQKDCTLREAVLAANANPGGDKVVLPKRKTYNLSIPNSNPVGEAAALQGDLDITDDLKIIHRGKGRAKVDANGIDRVFETDPSAPVDLALTRLTITGGDDPDDINGGGLRINDGSLTLRLSRLTNNASDGNGGGIYVFDSTTTVRIVRSTIRGNSADNNGGGIYNFFGEITTTISKSTITGNTAGAAFNGGGLYSDVARGALVASTISGNSAGANGGGVYLQETLSPFAVRNSTVASNRSGGFGGGIDVAGGAVLAISNSTLASNSAEQEGGGIASPGGDVSANAITVVRNSADNVGGGLTYGIGTPGFQVSNSLIALNSASFAPDCFAVDFDPFESGGHNLIGDDSECAGFDATGDFVNPNPKLGQLKNNGGPTQTVALKKGSPAINKAGDSAPNKDQRGKRRGKKPDIGAYERAKKKKKKRRR